MEIGQLTPLHVKTAIAPMNTEVTVVVDYAVDALQ
jgi:hypothetical protein